MITLTRPAADTELGPTIDGFHQDFSKLRRRVEWKQHVTGGCFVVEVTRGERNTHWHVHAHILVSGSYWAQKALQDVWSDVVGTRSIVHIEAIHEREKAARYLGKYLGKSSELTAWTDEQITQYADGIHRRRLVGTFGKWHRTDLAADEPKPEKRPLPRCRISASTLLELMAAGTINPQRTAPLLAKLGTTFRELVREWITPADWHRPPPEPADLADVTDLICQLHDRTDNTDTPTPPRATDPPPDTGRLFAPDRHL